MAIKGIKQSPEHIRKRVESKNGYKHSLRTKKKISKNSGSRRLEVKEKIRKSKLGRKLSEETKHKMRKSAGKGEKNHRWKGGKWSYVKRQIKIRDDYVCQICGLKDIEIMEVDHIKPKARFPELSLVFENLITLCPNCHRRKTNREYKLARGWE